MHLTIAGGTRSLSGEVVVPNSKYHAHRALILASLAPGTSRVVGLTDARHVEFTLRVLRDLGVDIEIDGDSLLVHGGRYRPRRRWISVGSSGSTLYFMTGLVSLASESVTITGQKYFQRRPIGPLLEALGELGVELSATAGCPPIHVTARRPRGGRVTIPGTLSQWISGLVMLAPFASGPTVVEVDGELNERPYVELTVAMMRRFGLRVEVSSDWRRYEIEPNQQAQPGTIALPPDIGSAAFGLAAAALHPSDVHFRGLTRIEGAQVDHPEAHFLDVARRMGVPMEFDERAGAVRVRHDGAQLRATTVDCRGMPDMLPILAVLGTFAEGETRFRNVDHVRLKESDRVSSMQQLNRMGGSVTARDGELVVRGVRRLSGAALSSFNDHRVLMSLAVAGSRADGATTLTYPHAYRISYPEFLDAMNAIGIPMSAEGKSGTAAVGQAAVIAPDEVAATPITERVWELAQQRPDELAIIEVDAHRPDADRPRSWTWRELTEQAEDIAGSLLRLGIRAGDTVAYQLPNWGEFVAVSLAALRVGAICCPLMPIFRERELAFALRRSKAKVLFIPEEFRGRDYPREVARLAKDVQGDAADSGELPSALRHVVVLSPGSADSEPLPDNTDLSWYRFADLLDGADGLGNSPELPAHPSPTELAQLLFTSGTSGEPKGVLHRFDALSRAAAMHIRHLGLGADERVYIPSPLAHQTGFLYGMWVAFVLGVPQIVQPVWEPHQALRALNAHGGTFVQAATPFLMDLVKAVGEGAKPPETLRVFVATGAAVPRALAERATRVLSTAVCGAWGSTESCLGTLSAPGDEAGKVWGTDGRPLEGVRIRVTDDRGTELAAGQEGNFELHSDCMFVGYLDRPDLTSEAFTADGWYRTGDLAVLDPSGFIRISGRVKDIINRGGEKIPVAEIEQLLHNHPAVADVAIVAMPDDRLGERACAFVVPAGEPESVDADSLDADSLDLVAMRRYLDEYGVARQYWPERLELVRSLPRNSVGKVQKFVLRERARDLQRAETEGAAHT